MEGRRLRLNPHSSTTTRVLFACVSIGLAILFASTVVYATSRRGGRRGDGSEHHDHSLDPIVYHDHSKDHPSNMTGSSHDNESSGEHDPPDSGHDHSGSDGGGEGGEKGTKEAEEGVKRPWKEMLKKPSCDCRKGAPWCLFERPYPPLFKKKSTSQIFWQEMDAADITLDFFYCSVFCSCMPLVVRNVFEVWPQLEGLTWDSLRVDAEKVMGITQRNTSLKTEPSFGNDKNVSMSEVLDSIRKKDLNAGYSLFYDATQQSKTLSNVMQSSPALFQSYCTLSLASAGDAVKIHSDVDLFGKFFGVVQGIRRYVLFHPLEVPRICHSSEKDVHIPPEFLPSMPTPQLEEDKLSIDNRLWLKVCTDGTCCYDMAKSEKENEKVFPKSVTTPRVEVLLSKGDFLYLPPTYLHAMESITDTIGMTIGSNNVVEGWSIEDRGFELMKYSEKEHRVFNKRVFNTKE